MISPDENFVFHGTPKHFGEIAIPKRNVRSSDGKIIFDQDSFHATPYRWIALAYTYSTPSFELDGKEVFYSMAVSLYEKDQHIIFIFGKESKEKTLEALYGSGGYIYWFEKSKFLYKEGLGTLEMITESPTKPYKIEKVINPVKELISLGIEFIYKDLTLPKNSDLRHYK